MGRPENSTMEAPPQQEIGNTRNQNQRHGRVAPGTPVQGENTVPIPNPTTEPALQDQHRDRRQNHQILPPIATSIFTTPFSEKLWALIFFIHLFAAIVFILYLAISNTSSASRHRLRRPIIWYRPLLTSIPVSLAFSLAYLLATLRHPAVCLQYSFWLSPLLALTASLLVLCTSTAAGNSFGPALLFLSIFQFIYACWITPRVSHSSDLLERALSAVHSRSSTGLLIWTACVSLASGAWSIFWVSGLVGAVAQPMAAVYVLVLFATLSWTTVVARCLVHLAVARAAGAFIGQGEELRASAAVEGAARSLGSACLFALVGPTVSFLRLIARAFSKVAREDEFLFSCAGCYRGIANRANWCANDWGLVHVALGNMAYAPSSRRAWEALTRNEMTGVADTDLTSPMCFAASVGSGALCVIAVGSWTFAIHRSIAATVSLFAFFIGYLITRIALAWPQACVGAYHVMYAENRYNQFFDATIPNRVRELQVADV